MNRPSLLNAGVVRALICASFALLTASAAVAQVAASSGRIVDAETKARIDTTLAQFVQGGMLAGVSALIYEKGEEVYFGAFGMADQEGGVPMARNTIVQIYSMTKPVTGVALMQLYDGGLFQLDDPLSRYAPAFSTTQVYLGRDSAGAPRLEAPAREISIRDVTRHTAGFSTGADTSYVGRAYAQAEPFALSNGLPDLVEKLASVPLTYHPGEQWAYGPAVDVQAYLVERIAGIHNHEYLRERIFEPLGMNETRFFVPEADRPRVAAMYRRSPDGTLTQLPREESHRFNFQDWKLTPGGWGLTSTLDDYMRFALMLQNEGELDGARILRAETVELMATNQLSDSVTERSFLPSKGSVGFGIDFAVRVSPPASPEENPGEVGEFFWDGLGTTLFWVDPKNDVTAVLFTQVMPFDPVGLHRSFRRAVYGSD